MTARNYSNTASEAELASLIGSGDTSAALTNFTGFPTEPFLAAFDPDTSDEEIVLVTGVAGSTVTMSRAYDGTTAKAHSAGSVFRHVAAAIDFQEANDHVNASTNVHGTAGALVGTTSTQTLTNKTLSAPNISSPTVTGTMAAAAATFSGSVTLTTTTATDLTVTTLEVTGDTTLADVDAAAVTGTTGAFSGAVTVGGTLGVTGAFTGSTASFSGLVTASTAPTLGGHLVNKTYADALGVSTATGSTIMRRDASGRVAVANPSASGDATNKGSVEAELAKLGHLGSSSPTSSGSVDETTTTILSVPVTIPSGLTSARRVEVIAGVHVETGSGIGAQITLISNDGFSDARPINVANINGDLTLAIVDADVTAGARTYSLQLKATVVASFDWSHPYMTVKVI